MALYFDNAIATQPSKRALDKQREALAYWQCLSSSYRIDSGLDRELTTAWEALCALLQFRDSDRLCITASGNEAVQQMFFGVFREALFPTGRNAIACPATDEASILLGAESLTAFHSMVQTIDVSESGGRVTRALLEQAVGPRTGLLSLSWAHGLTGVIQPMHDIAAFCEERNIHLHVEGSEILGKLGFGFHDLPIDYFTFDGARLHAPRGTGGLIMRSGSVLPPLIPDGIQQNGLRGGVFDTPAFLGLGEAAVELVEHFEHMCLEISRLRDAFEEMLQEQCPGITALFQTLERLPHTAVLVFEGVHAAHMQHALACENIYASRGGGIHQSLEHVLLASGVDRERAHSALGFSFSRECSDEEVETACRRIAEVYTRLAKGRSVHA